MRLRIAGGRPTSLRRRIVVPTAALTAVGMLALTGLVQLVLARIVSNEVDGALGDRANAVLQLITTGDGTLDPTSAPGGVADDHVWAFDASGALVGGSSVPAAVRDQLETLATTDERQTIDNDDYRLLGVPVPATAPAGAPTVIVVGEPLAPYETTETYALIASLAVGVLVVVGVSLVAAWTVRRSLDPVATMAARAADWSEHDLSRRFDLGLPRDEITSLAEVLDGLLDRVSRIILAEQRLTSELAHELRTPLTAMRAEAELRLDGHALAAEERVTLERVVEAVEQMTATIATLISASRTPVAGDETASARSVVAAAVAAMPPGSPIRVSHHDRDLVGDADDPELVLAAPHGVAVRALVPILENALRYQATGVDVSVSAAAASVEIAVRDDGPGISLDVGDVFSAGSHDPDSPGFGLGLALARRLARGLGGDVVVADADRGAAFVLTLPRSRPSTP